MVTMPKRGAKSRREKRRLFVLWSLAQIRMLRLKVRMHLCDKRLRIA